jgi:predicted nucleic acid-binding Zn finger protein
VRHERRWIVQGRTGCYTVWRHGDVPPEEDTWTCTCKGYHFKSRHRYRYHCRHIQAIRAEIIADFEEAL